MTTTFLASRRGREVAVAAAAFLLGLAWFCGHGGWHAIWPTHVAWVEQNDWSQHHLGWSFYRQAPTSWPLGQLPQLVHPIGSNLAYTDSAPLLSVLLAPLVRGYAGPLQYIGPLMAVSFALQGWFAARLARGLGATPLAQLLFAGVLVVCPLALHRIDHDTLTAHWTLLGALHAAWVGVGWPWRRVALGAAVLLYCAGMHPYLLAMTWPLIAVGALLHRQDGTLGRRHLAALAAALGPGCLATLYACGYFVAAGGSRAFGYGFYSVNLLGWFNPQGWSRLLPTLPVTKGQVYEGFAYLGLGALVALAALPWLLWCGRRGAAPAAGESRRTAVVAATCGGMALFALSDVVFAGHRLVLDAQAYTGWLQPLGHVFRSTGRFTWPLDYFVLALALRAGVRGLTPARLTAGLGVVLALQLADVRPQQVTQRLTSRRSAAVRDPRWALVGSDYDAVAMVPLNVPNSLVRCSQVRYPEKYELPLGLFAAARHLRINSAYVARIDDQLLAAQCTAQRQRWLREPLGEARTVYVVAPAVAQSLLAHRDDACCGVLDGYVVCTRRAVPTAFARALCAPPALPQRAAAAADDKPRLLR